MSTIREDKIVIFGAGKIGRSFIGQLFSLGGYEVVFCDVFQPLICELNIRRNYNVVIKSDTEEVINIQNVRGVNAYDHEKVAEEVATARILAVSVGLHGLNGIFPLLAEGLKRRYDLNSHVALDIIIAENMRDADDFFRAHLNPLLPQEYPFDKLIGLVETSIGKMVPIMLNKDIEADILQVFAEPYNTLILDKRGFRNAVPDISGLAPKENMKAWVDRKLFIHNLGHAAGAYYGFMQNPRNNFMYEVLTDPEVFHKTRAAMLQSADILMMKYPGEFSKVDLTLHIDDLLIRFQNKALGDTVFRVGCDLMRKLAAEDRLSGAIKAAITYNLPYDKILNALICGFHFRATDENGELFPRDVEFIKHFDRGTNHLLKEICGFDEHHEGQVFEEARWMERQGVSG